MSIRMRKKSRSDSRALLSKKSGEEPETALMLFENSEWLTTAEAACYLRRLTPEGFPSADAIHQMVSRGKIRRRKWCGRLYFKRRELDYLLESSG